MKNYYPSNFNQYSVDTARKRGQEIGLNTDFANRRLQQFQTDNQIPFRNFLWVINC